MSAVVESAARQAAAAARVLRVIGAEIGEGASDPGCRGGAAALFAHGLIAGLANERFVAKQGCTVSATTRRGDTRLAVAERFSQELAPTVLAAIGAHELPVVIGGDHSCAVGTWSAVAHAHRSRGDVGLIWVDAHLDAHTPATSDSGAPHGMPLAALLGHGSAGFTDLFGWSRKIEPRHVVVIGARSYEPAEQALLKRLGVRVMFMDEVEERGFGSCFDEACRRVSRDTSGWGISFDLDGLDPVDAPGTGTPVDRGVRLDEALHAMRGCGSRPGFAALELTEYNPARDEAGRTAEAAIALLSAVLR